MRWYFSFPVGFFQSQLVLGSLIVVGILTANISAVQGNMYSNEKVTGFAVHEYKKDEVNNSKRLKEALQAYTDKHYETARMLLEPLAIAGDFKAQTALGGIYLLGQGVEKNYGIALGWFRLAADAGHDHAQYFLGKMHGDGLGVPKDEKAMFKWFKLAVKQGHPAAKLFLRKLINEGHPQAIKLDAQLTQHVKDRYAKAEKAAHNKDYKTAVRIYRKLAVVYGYPKAQFSLGLSYRNGLGVPKNDKLAVDWYRKAARQGNPNAQINLGVMYSKGLGVNQNINKAMNWWTKAANNGYLMAHVKLAIFNFLIMGKAENKKHYMLEAYKWASIVQKADRKKISAHDDTSTKFIIDAIKNNMEPAEVAETRRQVTSFLAKFEK
ncbi:MAG: hypothetical protein CMQ51_00980 [Gammaproteobacteria bacterium]|nr:hypothetical protein [Gammaproteobacteria bacterium]